jgi:peptide/nickel transport system substrate-binding protein
MQNDASLPWDISGPAVRTVSAIDTPDDHTVVMHWRSSNAFADAATLGDLMIYPEHLIRPVWEAGEGDRLFSHEYFREGFVGLGPYQLERWNPDGTVVFRAFDDYFLGPPKVGTIVSHIFDTPQGVLTALLAGTLHLTGVFSLRFEEAVAAQEQWEARGEGKVLFTPTGFMRIMLPPQNPLFQDVRVRRALLLSIDRDEVVRTLLRGTSPLAHTLLHPNELGYQTADAAVAKYAFDPRLALALMEQAGWQRGADGILTNAAGERFEVPFRVLPTESEHLRVQGAVASYWKDIGVQVSSDNVAASIFNDRTERANYRGVTLTNPATTLASLYRRWHSSTIPRAETRFVGDNQAAWNHPEADRLLDRIASTIDIRQAEPDLVALAKLFSDELPVLPLYFITEPIAIHRRLKHARPRPNSSQQNSITWSAYQWEWE